jgi:hypothetical protein
VVLHHGFLTRGKAYKEEVNKHILFFVVVLLLLMVVVVVVVMVVVVVERVSIWYWVRFW